MNKVLAILFFASVPALGAPKVEIEIKSVTNLHIEDYTRIKIDGDKIFVNAFQVNAMAMPQLMKPIQVLSKVQTERQIQCAPGTYTHTVKINGSTKLSKGCINSSRAVQIWESVRNIKALAQQFPHSKK